MLVAAIFFEKYQRIPINYLRLHLFFSNFQLLIHPQIEPVAFVQINLRFASSSYMHAAHHLLLRDEIKEREKSKQAKHK